MAEKRTASTSSAGPSNALQRGKACLRCRKRKMRCDGAKPACHQCVRAKKADTCEYDDGKGKTRTQLLRENIARLEQRIRELEDPEYVSPAVTLYDPNFVYSGSSSSSSADSPGTISLSSTQSPFPIEVMGSPQTSWDSLSRYPSPSQASEMYAMDEVPRELAQILLEIFLPHRHQCGLGIHVGRLRESLSLPPEQQRHPVLMNSIYLWSCFFSRPGPLSMHESHYLARALDSLNDALKQPSKVIDVIQASCLLSLYFLCNGRLLEGTYHASAAASLTVQWGLHRLALNESSFGGWEPLVLFKLEQPKDAIEEGERILTFWQTFDLDRCWSVALQRPPTIQDGKNSYHSINVPWPQTIEEYASGQLDSRDSLHTIRTFLEGHGYTLIGGFSTRALRVKASALLESANELSSSWDLNLTATNSFSEEFRSLEHTIVRFLTTLIPVQQLGGAMPEDKHALILIHTLAHAAMIHLHYRFSQDNAVSHEKCMRAARACITIIKHVSDTDFDFLDPIIGPCWMAAANTLNSEFTRIEGSWPLLNSAEVRNDISLIQYAMTKLSTRFPLLGFQAAEVQRLLSGV